MKALIASGTERYSDPWHPFPRTTPRIGSILHRAGFQVSVDHDVDRAMSRLDDVDLLVVNAGDPWRNENESPPENLPTVSLDRALEKGIGVVAIHCAVASLRDYPGWAPAIGATWIPGSSFHPPIGDLRVEVGDGGEFFDVFDEGYCRLQRLGESHTVAQHQGPDGLEPSAWTRHVGQSRVAVDVFGHDERSYESAGHRTLLQRLALWAAGAGDPDDRNGRL